MSTLPITRTDAGYQLGNLMATGLPRAQSHALLLRARGISYRTAADMLSCSAQNIKSAIGTLFYKTHTNSTPELITAAFESGLLRIVCLLLTLHLSAGQIIDTDARRELRTRPRGSRQITRRPPKMGEHLLWDPDTNTLITTPEATT